jgi:hypothetical protein
MADDEGLWAGNAYLNTGLKINLWDEPLAAPEDVLVLAEPVCTSQCRLVQGLQSMFPDVLSA